MTSHHKPRMGSKGENRYASLGARSICSPEAKGIEKVCVGVRCCEDRVRGTVASFIYASSGHVRQLH